MMKRLLTSLYKRLLGKDNRVVKAYAKENYLDAYSLHTDVRIEEDPKAAIGGNWEEIGALQFEFLKQQGLGPHHRFLDIGCGTLRGGRHFIRFLEPALYTGMDISVKAIEHAEKLVREEGLAGKKPRLLVSSNKDLRFSEFPGEAFDFMLAQSVFTHLMPEHIEECFAHIGTIMHDDSVFYFTYFKSEDYKQINFKDFSYPRSFFEKLAQRYGFQLSDHTEAYRHPKGQNMLSIKRAK